MKQRDWSPAEDARMDELIARGWSSARIGAELNRTQRSVTGRAGRRNVTIGSRKNAKCAERRLWTDEEHQRFVELAARKVYVTQIVVELNRTKRSLVHYAYRHSIKLTFEPRKPGSGRSFSATDWTEEEHARLVELAAGGLSAREIGRLLGRSRNGIISRCNRKNVQLRAQPGRQPGAARRVVVAKERRPRAAARSPTPPAEVARLPIDESILVTIERIGAHRCRYPIKRNDDNEWLFCNRPQQDDSSYCEEHTHDCHRERKRYKR